MKDGCPEDDRHRQFKVDQVNQLLPSRNLICWLHPAPVICPYVQRPKPKLRHQRRQRETEGMLKSGHEFSRMNPPESLSRDDYQ